VFSQLLPTQQPAAAAHIRQQRVPPPLVARGASSSHAQPRRAMGAACVSHPLAQIPDRSDLTPLKSAHSARLDATRPDASDCHVSAHDDGDTDSPKIPLVRSQSFHFPRIDDLELGSWRAQEISTFDAQLVEQHYIQADTHGVVECSSHLRSQTQIAVGSLSLETHLDCRDLDCVQRRVQTALENSCREVGKDQSVKEPACGETRDVWHVIKTIDPYATEKTIEQWIETKKLDAERDGVSFSYFIEEWVHGVRAKDFESLQTHTACLPVSH